MTGESGTGNDGGLAFFAKRFGIDASICNGLIELALESGGDYADLYFEYTRQRTILLEDRAVRGASSGIIQGLGVRVVDGEGVGYAYTEQFELAGMRQAVRTAAKIAGRAGSAVVHPQPVAEIAIAGRYPVEFDSIDEPVEQSLALLRDADEAARSVASSIYIVEAHLIEQTKQIAIATSEGRLVGDRQPLIKFHVRAHSARGADRQVGMDGRGYRSDLDLFTNSDRSPSALGRRAAERAVLGHDAVDAPAGFLPVVLAAGESGVWLHEAVGHGLEADFNRKRHSNYSDRIGDAVASPLCTVVDDGTLPRLQGSINVDDEGQEARYNVLIEEGILHRYMQDWISARHYRVEPSGNGRRQDFRHVPMPRMTNTYMLPGESDPNDIIKAVKRGVYCVSFSGGQVDISSGDYVFGTGEAYLIEDGKVTAPIRTTNLIGNGPDSLTRVTMVGNDLAVVDIAGTCGKGGLTGDQSLPVGLGLPTVLVDGITVGGTQQ